jgi:toxin ParE1/3/4
VSPSVVFTPEAQDQLVDLYRYIATRGSADAAAHYTEAIVAYCEELAAFPHRGRGA